MSNLERLYFNRRLLQISHTSDIEADEVNIFCQVKIKHTNDVMKEFLSHCDLRGKQIIGDGHYLVAHTCFIREHDLFKYGDGYTNIQVKCREKTSAGKVEILLTAFCSEYDLNIEITDKDREVICSIPIRNSDEYRNSITVPINCQVEFQTHH